jgi:hypothetical protein
MGRGKECQAAGHMLLRPHACHWHLHASSVPAPHAAWPEAACTHLLGMRGVDGVGRASGELGPWSMHEAEA